MRLSAARSFRFSRIAAGLVAACCLPMASAQLVADPGLSADKAPAQVARWAIGRDGDHAPSIGKADAEGFVTLGFAPAARTTKAEAAPGPLWFTVRPEGKAWDWHAAQGLRMHIQNPMPWALTLLVQIEDEAGGKLESTIALPPGAPFMLSVPLAATQPLKMGMRSGPPMPWNDGEVLAGLAQTTTGKIDAKRIRAVRIGMPAPDAEQKIRLGKIFLPPVGRSDLEMAYTGIVDAWGQYTRLDWPGKYHQPTKIARALERYAPEELDETASRKARLAAKRRAAKRTAKQKRAWQEALKDARTDFSQYARNAELQMNKALLALQDDGQDTAASEAQTDRYGGLKQVEGAGKGTGWFRTGKLQMKDGSVRHILLTPEGNPFFSFGVNAIQRDNSETFVGGREFQFTGLPHRSTDERRFLRRKDSTDFLSADSGAQQNRRFLKGETFNFYQANLFRRDGDNWPQRWVMRTGKRLKSWGFNTVGAWSDDSVTAIKMPYTRIAHISGPFARLSDGNDWWSGIPDPFDPAFGLALEQTLRKEVGATADDPWLVGWFVDNELGWGDGSAPDPKVRYALAYSALGMDAAKNEAHAKRAFVKMLRERYEGSIGELAKAWQRPAIRRWQDVEAALGPEQLPDGKVPAVAADLSAFLRLHADSYYGQVKKALKKHAPHHLYLGSRFAGRTPESVASCARWCDVISFNLYIPSLKEGFEAEDFARIDKPAMLTEFHFGSADRGPFWPGVMVVNTEAERGPAYRKMMESVLANPQFVGAHWFQYLDQPVTGRWLDGENGHLGLVSITDVPWHDFVLSVAKTNQGLLRTLGTSTESVAGPDAAPSR